MAYVEPNGTIQLFCNVGIDSSYRNTFWFDTIGDQTNYFSSLSGTKTYPKCYYTRKNRGYIRVKDLADHLYNYNYMRYNNYSHKNKWIYCFITSVDYINENTTQINYEVDVIQTYMFDVRIRNSFVERQHSFTDEIGDNLVVEDLDIGRDYLVERHGTLVDLTPDRIALVASRQLVWGGTSTLFTKATPAYSVINGVGAKAAILVTRQPVSASDASTITTSLETLFSSINDNEIITAFMYNKKLDTLVTSQNLDNVNYAGNFVVPTQDPVQRCIYSPNSYSETITSGLTLPQTFGNYTPKNKKLLTYPFKYFTVNGADHDEQEYKYELFLEENNSRPINFLLQGAIFPHPQYLLAPKNYFCFNSTQHGVGTLPVAYECAVHINDYVNVPYSTDVYKAYLLQTRGSRGYAIAKTIFDISTSLSSSTIKPNPQNIMGTYSSGQPMSALAHSLIYGKANNSGKEEYESPEATTYTTSAKASNFGAIGNMLINHINAKGLPNGMNGSFNSDGLLAGNNRFRFEYFQYCIKPEYAKIIDDYFTMCGYAMKEYMGVISPSSENQLAKMRRRKLWNYTKTVGCNVISAPSVLGCTSNEIDKIADIYDNGITFWNTSQPIGSYNGDNSPRA